MCQFNLLISDKKNDAEKVKDLLSQNGFRYFEINIKSLREKLGEEMKIILTTKGHCDCGSVLGMNANRFDETKERKKLKKKKWSTAKIDRYIEDKLKNGDAKVFEEENNWLELIGKMKNQKMKFGILFHQFSGELEMEQIEIGKTFSEKVKAFNRDTLRNLSENELCWIV